jgi:UDP-N-acetyl-D-mannosaminuronate dehydrogenase
VPLAFGRKGATVIGFDIDAGRISELKAGRLEDGG